MEEAQKINKNKIINTEIQILKKKHNLKFKLTFFFFYSTPSFLYQTPPSSSSSSSYPSFYFFPLSRITLLHRHLLTIPYSAPEVPFFAFLLIYIYTLACLNNNIIKKSPHAS
jgi:hypothetical protein